MRAISAVDSVSLAIQRTRQFLFRPFRWGTYLKLGLVAIITEGIGGHSGSSAHGNQPWARGTAPAPPFNLSPQWIALIVAAVLVLIVVGIIVFYLVTRLRFAFFHCLTQNTTEIRPGWRLYGAQAMRFFWLNLGVGFCFLLLLALVSIPFIAGFWRLIHAIPPGGQPDLASVLALVLPLIPVILLLVLAAFLIDVVLRDWMLPHFALEDASAGEAWAEVWERIQAEPREFFVYALLRLVLPLIASVALFAVLLIPGLMLAGTVGAIEYGIHSAFVGSTGASALAGILLEVFFGIIAFVFLMLASICLGGPVSTGVREYALVFYGGRYTELGAMLNPPQQPAV
jgi:hypothetical protein